MNEQTEQQNEESLDVCPKSLSLKDNRQLMLGEHQLSEQQLELLRHFSGKKLKEIKRSDGAGSEGLVIIGNIDAIKEDDTLFELLENPDSKTPDGETGKEYIVQAHNIMGVFTLRHGGAQLRIQITSRFDKSYKQPFLCWMLERVLRISLSDLVDTQRDSSFWTILLELLFWKRLGEASSIGLYRQYQRFEYNDLRLRGRLDIDRHIRLNMPLWDKIAYSRREITYDNPVNHLFRHAIRFVMSHWQDAVVNGQDNKNSLDMAGAIEANTPSWMPGNIHELLMKKELLQGINHPYYAESYEELRILALCIILEHGVDLYTKNNPDDFRINGILFDGAWLWEEYLSTILTGEGFWHAIPMDTLPIYALKKERHGRRPLFPDFRLPNGTSKQLATAILDAKYKRGDSVAGLAVRREDMHQCFCYMLLTGAIAGGMVYPPVLADEKCSDDVNDEEELKIYCPEERYWHCFTFESVDDCTDDTFPERMRANEERLRRFIQEIKELVQKQKLS